MPLIQVPTPSLEIEIPDFVQGETVIKRTATLFTMIYSHAMKQLVLTWIVKHFAKNTDGSKGEYLKIITDWSKESIADNTTMCNAANGHPIEKIQVGTDEQGEPVMDYDPAINYMGQYDFFYTLAHTQPVHIHPMIVQFGSLVKSWDKR